MIILGLLLLIVVAVVWLLRKDAKEAKRLGAKMHTPAYHLLGVPGLEPKEVVGLFLADERMFIRAGKKTIEFDYGKITMIKAARKTDLVTQNKSVIGRGVVGGLAFGGVGAIVGALSAVGGVNAVKGDLLIMYYKSDYKDEPQPIVFSLLKMSLPKKIEKFVLQRRPELVESNYITM